MRRSVLAIILGVFAFPASAAELFGVLPDTLQNIPRSEQLEEVKRQYKTWGAIAFAKTGTHKKDITIISIVLNQREWKTARDKAYHECVDQKIGPCSIATFPGCLFVNVGRRIGERVPVYGISPTPDHLVQECKTHGFQCAPPIGGCNYLDEEGKNGYARNSDKNPIAPAYAPWILEVGQ